MKEPKLIIENLEEYSDWVMLEYKHSIDIWESIAFTNVKDEKLKKELSKIAKVYEKSICEFKLENMKIIVLDPFAKKEFTTEDGNNADIIVVGGILGDKEFTGKTNELITKKLPNANTRNLGKKQLSIDISVFTARLIFLGMKLEEIEFTDELEIDHCDGHKTILPYGYPIIENKVIVTPGLIELLKKL